MTGAVHGVMVRPGLRVENQRWNAMATQDTCYYSCLFLRAHIGAVQGTMFATRFSSQKPNLACYDQPLRM